MITDDPILARLRSGDPLMGGDLPDLDWESRDGSRNRGRLRRARARRLVPLVAVATAAAVAVVALPVMLPGPSNDDFGAQGGLRDVLPNAAAADLRALAAQVPSTVLGDDYVHWREVSVSLVSLYREPDATPARHWESISTERWMGAHCDDRQVETWQPYRFVTPDDERRWRDWASSADVDQSDRAAAEGGTREWAGSQLWSDPATGEAADPCERRGSIENLTPAYTVTLPRDPRALIDRLASDLNPVVLERDPYAVSGVIVTILGLPWLTQGERATAIAALGLSPRAWSVTERFTVEGHPALRLAYEEHGLRFDMVVVAAAPSIWEQSVTIVDPEMAAAFTPDYAGLPAGTVLTSTTVSDVSVLASRGDRA